MIRSTLPLLVISLVACHGLYPFTPRSSDSTAEPDGPTAADLGPGFSDLAVDQNAEDTLPAACSMPTGPQILTTADFEGIFPPPGWNYDFEGQGTFRQTSTRSHCGEMAGWAQGDPRTLELSARLTHQLGSPLLSGAIHVRAHFFVPEDVKINDWMILLMVAGLDDPDKVSADLGQDFRIDLSNDVADEFDETPFFAVSTGVWFCLELGVDIHDVSGRVSIWLDDGLVLEQEGFATRPPDGITQVQVGIVRVMQDPSLPMQQLYLDDIVVSTSKIGCQ